MVEHRLEGEELVCPACGSTMTEIGKEVVRTPAEDYLTPVYEQLHRELLKREVLDAGSVGIAGGII